MTSIEDKLRTILYRAFCPESIELGDYALNLLSRGRTVSIRIHLKECPHCRREFEQLQAFLTSVHSDIAFNIMDQICILVARLVKMDGGYGFTPALQGVRGGENRVLSYETEGKLIVLDIQNDHERGDLKSVYGLLTGVEAAQEFEVQLLRNGELTACSTVDDLGNFTFVPVDLGSYDLVFVGPGVEIHIERLGIE
jgi:hypothetical protein